MGKKTKKTRWRTLSIGDGCSDTETSAERSRTNQKYGRTNGVWYNSSNQKYSNESTPVKHQYERNHHYGNQKPEQSRGHWNYARAPHQETSKSTTRSSSTVSEHKIKFNEDEYTRITTPRQDVLFKKGYLSKPKPYLQQQRSLTSTGNSTGDGTPDHQSADGNDLVDSDYDQSPFMFPAAGGCNSGSFMDGGGMFFVNGFEPYAVPPHHVLVYDQYGNAVVCLQPQPQPQLPAPLQQPPPTIYDRRTKRYSTDSMTESTSPHNETDDPVNEATVINSKADADAEQTRIRKKRRRKKPNKSPAAASGDVAELSSDELSSLSGEEEEDLKSDTDEVSTTNSCKYRVDAEEFVPRCYRQQQQQQHMEFVPLPVGVPLYAGPATFVPTMFPLTNHQIYFNNPHHFSTTTITEASSSSTITTTTSAITNEPDQDEISVEQDAIDIEKIVSKLEQAAKEQVTDVTTITTTTTTIKEKEECAEPIINTETNKTESVPLTTIHQEHQKHQATNTNIVENVRYSERLKQSHNHNHNVSSQTKPQQKQQSVIKQKRTTNQQTCPRLERSASSRQKTNTNNNYLKTIPSSTTTTTTTASSNQWIAVSGKKKRGKNKQLLTEVEAEEPQQTIEEQVIEPEVTIEEIVEQVKVEAPKDEVKQRPIKNNPKKPLIKKRILINDDLIVANSPKSIIVPKSSLEEKTVVPVEHFETSTTNKSKKKVNKKSKSKSAIKPNECNNNIDKLINNEEVETVTTNVNEFSEEETNKKDDDDVSLELDRMIQRGLYGNLEQRLRSFNPTDSFLKQTQNVKRFDTAATAAASVIGTMAAAVLKKPSTYFGQTSNINSSSTSTNGFIPPKVIINEVEVDQDTQRFPITRAVREWMNKTRENTPEVEIFKNPNEIRQEFNLIMDQSKTEEEEIKTDTIENGVEIHEPKEHHHQVDEMSSVLGDEDLLDCWEPEISYDQHQLRRKSKSVSMDQQQSTIVEQAEDVLETYDSVYGRSDDFARIQREVQRTTLQNNTINNNNNPRVSGVDGALPYRAICCSIM